MFWKIRITYSITRGDGLFGLQFYGAGERIVDGFSEHDTKIFIGDI